MAPAYFSLAEQTLDNTIGAVFLGVVGAALLFGITTVQAYSYYHAYPNDSPLHRCAVGLLWTLDAFHLALTIETVYSYAVRGFGNSKALLNIPWSMQIQVSINVIIIVIVHSLYALRVWRLGNFHGGVLGYIVVSVVAAGFAIGVVLSYKIFTVHQYPELAKISWVITAALGISTAIDFVISASMCHYLWKSKGSLTRLNSKISKVMQYTLSTGLFTSACSLSALFCYNLLPNTLIFLALEFCLTKLYVGSFLAMLNARERKDGESTFNDLGGNISVDWQKIKIQTATSSFWSPRPQSLALTPPTMTLTTEPGTMALSHYTRPSS